MKNRVQRLIFTTLFVGGFLFAHPAQAQYQTVRMNATTNGTVVNTPLIVRDDDSQGLGAPEAGYYMMGIDYSLTIQSDCENPARLGMRIDTLAINCLDTLYIYDGPSTSSPLLAKINNFFGGYAPGDIIFVSPNNNTNTMTLRFRTDPHTDTSRTHLSCASYADETHRNNGFLMTFVCDKPCESVVPFIESMFFRTRNGEVYDTGYTKLVTEYDTVRVDAEDPTSEIDHIDTNVFTGAHLCIGDGVIFRGYGEYSHRHGYYNPTDVNTMFIWDLDNEGDSIVGIGQTEIAYADYQNTGCYDLTLNLIDAGGCHNTVIPSIRVRTAMNPIKTIFTLKDICNNDSLMVNMGFEGEDATLTLQRILSDSSVSKANNIRTFIPDGPNCSSLGYYYEAPVEFSEFPNGRTVTSAKDICSLCINMEHTFLGDVFISLVCPTGQEAYVVIGNQNTSTAPPITVDVTIPGAAHGSSTDLGYPYTGSGGATCDSLMQPFGVGLDYCFSRDTQYTLVTGDNARTVWQYTNNPAGNFYLSSMAYTEQSYVTSPPIPAGFYNAGQTPQVGGTHKIASDHEAKANYYLPFSTFSELVGCPLNGIWAVRVYDVWGQDNGWIFNWNLELCNINPNDCKYQVDIDSLVWAPDPSPQYHDYDLGHYRGVKVNAASPTVSYISSPDTAGTFPILVKVYDAFGCVWDTNTSITTRWAPTPNLGPDTGLCGVDRMLLDARDRHSETLNYTYVWEPFGQDSATIMTAKEPGQDITYVVNALHHAPNGLVCEGYDTIHVGIRRQPIPRFVSSPFVFEGCDPFTLSFENQSIDAVEHLWEFGDGVTSSLASPTHTYGAGIYDLKYYATSADGCVDSVISPGAIAVYSAPQASFTWTPTYPSVVNPVATFNNLTSPHTSQTRYFWEIQYNVENPLSVETFTTRNLSYDFSTYTDDDPSGSYAVRLIARTDNLAPSGNMVYCRDTAENTILVVNDFLQFPNVVSPNGDGINDRFVIKNLVEGLGYPINSLDIYNKWGTRVYHKENISRDEDFWDPKDMPVGTYFYRFSAKGYNGNIEHNGAIEVVR